jgi:hypothetical protein
MRSARPRPPSLAPLLLAAFTVTAAACNNGSTTPTPVLSTENLTGTVAVQGSDSKRFTVNYALTASDASVTVTGLTTAAGAAVTTTIGVAFGQVAFDGSCTAAAQYTANAATIGQELVAYGAFLGPIVYCIKVFDAGTLTEPLNYAITVKHY